MKPEQLLEALGDAVLSIDVAGMVTHLNPAAELMTGWTRVEAQGRPVDQVMRLIDRDTRQVVPNPLRQAVKLTKTVNMMANAALVRRDGHEIPIEDSAAPVRDRQGRLLGAVMVFRDVGPALDLSRRMAVLAHFDALTGLPNRLLLNDRLTEAIALRRRQRKPLAVCLLDLDRFKSVNDSWGHVVGDRLLRSVADRLVGSLRRSDTVSRYGGDEFVVLLSEMGQAAHAEPVAKKLLRALEQPHRIDGRDLKVSGSVGVALYPDDGEEPGTLIAHADTALYDAKRHAKGSWRRFSGGTGAPQWLEIASTAPGEPTTSAKTSA